MDNNGSVHLPTKWVENFVKETITRALSTTAEKGSRKSDESNQNLFSLPYDLFETHHTLVVRIRIPDSIHIRNIRILIASSHMRLEKLPAKQNQRIDFPVLVSQEGASAMFKQNILEISLAKLEEQQLYQELNIE